MSKTKLDMAAWIIVLIGALSIGLEELNFDLLGLLGSGGLLTTANYLIGISAVYGIYMMATMKKH